MIQRYQLELGWGGNSSGAKMQERLQGDYVLYSDHCAAIKQLREALKELLVSRCSPLEVVGHHPKTGHALNREGIAAYKAEQALEATKEGQ
jgi:hypothetical protein